MCLIHSGGRVNTDLTHVYLVRCQELLTTTLTPSHINLPVEICLVGIFEEETV